MFWTVFFACLLAQLVASLLLCVLIYGLPRLVARFYRPVIDEVDRANATSLTEKELAVLEEARAPMRKH